MAQSAKTVYLKNGKHFGKTFLHQTVSVLLSGFYSETANTANAVPLTFFYILAIENEIMCIS